MDVLSDVITTLRTGAPDGAVVGWNAPWGVRFADEPDTVGFLVVIRGAAWLRDAKVGEVSLGPGDVVFSPRGHGYVLADGPTTSVDPGPAVHDLGAAVPDDASTAVTVCGGYRLDPDRTHPLLSELPEVVHLPAGVGQRPELRAAVEILGREIGGDRPGSAAITPMAFDLLLLYALRDWLEGQPSTGVETGWAAALSDDATNSALTAIHKAPGHPWTVDELAARAGLSRAAFARRFARLVGQPPLAYLTRWRMTTAAGLLRDTDTTLQAIATRVGYGSEFAFGNAFKREYGIAPGRFRRRAAEARASGRVAR